MLLYTASTNQHARSFKLTSFVQDQTDWGQTCMDCQNAVSHAGLHSWISVCVYVCVSL